MQEKYKEETTTGIVERLSERLYKLTRNTNGEALFDQWESDRKAIKQGLGQVGRIFPHYSLHDESHCRTILNNIVMLVGEELIFNLSATDIWLLLSAVYFHDTGMILTNEEEQALINEGKLAQLVKDAQADPQHAMHGQAINFEIDEDGKHLVPKTKYVTKDWTDDYTFLLAELVRKGHAVKAGSVIDQNKKGDAKDWLRTSKLPNRLYEILKRVCYAHGDDFSAVMALPDEQSGLDTECFHPRFIAAMLRMGDLLDVDHKRFSEVMLAGLSKMPESSQLHMQKHASITQFSIRKKIEIIAELEEPGAAEITQTWFEWIEDEYKKLSLHWASVCVFTNASLPTLGKLSVEVKDYIPLNREFMPKFKIDNIKALEYLGGDNLYPSKYDCLRELITNSLDATKIRAHYENPSINNLKPDDREFIDTMNNYSIDFTIDYLYEDTATRTWEINITDDGCGMSLEAINQLLHVGVSSKRKIYDTSKMSTFLKPSGSFGIGFQSVFMLTEEVKITTKDMLSNETYQIFIQRKKRTLGNVKVKKLQSQHEFRGTSVSFILTLPMIGHTIRWSLGGPMFELESIMNKQLKSGLLIETGDFFYNEHNLLKKATMFLEGHPVKSKIKSNKLEIAEYNNYLNKSRINKKLKWEKCNNINFSYYFEYKGVVLFMNTNSGNVKTKVNGAPIQNNYFIEANNAELNVDIYGIDPIEHITINRDKFKESFNEIFVDIRKKATLSECNSILKGEKKLETGSETVLCDVYTNHQFTDDFKNIDDFNKIKKDIENQLKSINVEIHYFENSSLIKIETHKIIDIISGSVTEISTIKEQSYIYKDLNNDPRTSEYLVVDKNGCLYIHYKYNTLYYFFVCYSINHSINTFNAPMTEIQLDKVGNPNTLEKHIIHKIKSKTQRMEIDKLDINLVYYMPYIDRMGKCIVKPNLKFAFYHMRSKFSSIFDYNRLWVSPPFDENKKKFEMPDVLLQQIYAALLDKKTTYEELKDAYIQLCNELNEIPELDSSNYYE